MTFPTARSAASFGHLALLVVSVAAAVSALVEAATLAARGLIVPLQLVNPYAPDGAAYPGATFPGQPAGTGATARETTVELYIHDASAPHWLKIANGADVVLGLLALAAGAWLLAAVVRTVADGRPLHRRNPHRLAGVAVALLIGGLGGPLADDAARRLVVDRLEAGDVLTVHASLSVVPVVAAAVVLALTWAVRRGARSTEPRPVQPATAV